MSQSSTAATPPAVLVTGCSTGLGLEIALHLAEKGLDVFASMRNFAHEDELVDAARKRGVALHLLQLDVTDSASIDAALETVFAATGGALHGLVNNAGIGLRGCLEDLADAEIRDVYEANVFGTIAVTKRVLPHLRGAHRGRIVTIGSVGGRIATFGLSVYCSSKFALEGFCEALALEVEPFGLKSILVEPGIIKTTRWTTNRGLARNGLNPASPYHEMFIRAEAIADRLVERSRTQPVDVAKAVHHALTARRPKMRYVVGRPASAAIALRRYMPDRLFERFYFGTLLRQLTVRDQVR